MCDTQYTDEYCVCIYSEAKMHNTARVSRFLFVSGSSLPEYFLNHNLGFWCTSSSSKTNEKSLEKRLLCYDDDDDNDDDDAEKRGRVLLHVILLIFF